MNSAVRASLMTVIAIGVVLAWLYLAPASLGGQVTLAVTQGSSMEPLLSEGDLAVLRTVDDVEIGDVFGYEDQTIGQNVVHRVVDYRVTGAGVRYVLQGDNNTWLDPEQPAGKDLIGKLWFHIPGAGRVVQWIREPLHGGAVAGLVAAMMAVRYRLAKKGGRFARRRGGHKVPRPATSGRNWHKALLLAASPKGQAAQGVSIVAMLVCAGLLVVAFSAPTTRPATNKMPYEHSGRFSYSNDDVRSDVFDGPLQPGDPVFLNDTDELMFRFDYSLKTEAVRDLTGTASLYTQVRDTTGWKRTFEIVPATAFEGNSVTLEANTELPGLMEIIREYQTLRAGGPAFFTAAVIAEVDLRGTLGVDEFNDQFRPTLEFRVRPPNEMYIESPTNYPSELAGSENRSDPMIRTKGGLALLTITEPNEFDFGVLTMTVPWARHWAAISGLLAALAVGMLAFLARRAREQGEPFMIMARYGDRLVKTSTTGDGSPVSLTQAKPDSSLVHVSFERPSPGQRPVRLEKMEDLVRLADRYGRMILWEELGGVDAYFVNEEGAVYYYLSISAGVEVSVVEKGHAA